MRQFNAGIVHFAAQHRFDQCLYHHSKALLHHALLVGIRFQLYGQRAVNPVAIRRYFQLHKR